MPTGFTRTMWLAGLTPPPASLSLMRSLYAAAARLVGEEHLARAGVLLQIRADEPGIARMTACRSAREDDVEHLGLVEIRCLAVCARRDAQQSGCEQRHGQQLPSRFHSFVPPCVMSVDMNDVFRCSDSAVPNAAI